MVIFEFSIFFKVPPEAHLEALASGLQQAAFSDAVIGIGRQGRLVLDTERPGKTALDALQDVISDVRIVIPEAALVEVKPDQVTVTDIAILTGCSRQNVRKILLADASFPSPFHCGDPEMFHLTDVLEWVRDTQRLRLAPGHDGDTLLEIAQAARQINACLQARRLPNSHPTDNT